MILFKFSFFLIFIVCHSFAQNDLEDPLNLSPSLKIRKNFPGYRVHYDPMNIAQKIQKELDEQKNEKIKNQNEDKKIFKFIKR